MAKVGRPRKINSVRQFEERAEAYFRECEAREEPVLLTGLILALGLSSRKCLDEYGQREEFREALIKSEFILFKKAPSGAM